MYKIGTVSCVSNAHFATSISRVLRARNNREWCVSLLYRSDNGKKKKDELSERKTREA